jgi:hypothetical protein
MTAEQIQAILSLYAKHGWRLRRVLLTPALKSALRDSLPALFDSAEIIESEIDAIWFFRPSGEEREAWELRRLSTTPYALFELFENEDEEEVREEIRHEMESRLK